MNKGISIFIAVLLCAALTVLSSCSFMNLRDDKKEKDLVEIIVMESGHSLLNLPVYAAIENNFFKDQGLIVRLEIAASKEEAESALTDGLVHFLLGGFETNIYLLQKTGKANVHQIAQIAQYPNSFLLTRDTGSPFEWKNLKGKVVLGYNEGDTSQLIFQYLLRINELHPLQDVHIIHNLPYNLRSGAFKSGSGHFILASEPQASALELENIGQVVFLPINELSPIPTNALFSLNTFSASNNEICQKFVNALYQGLNWVNSNDPETLSELASKYFPGQEKALLRGVSRLKTHGSWVESPVIDVEGVAHFMTIMHTNRELLKTISPDLLVNNTFAEKALIEMQNKQDS